VSRGRRYWQWLVVMLHAPLEQIRPGQQGWPAAPHAMQLSGCPAQT
jgi:hypothetical protein